MKFKLFRFWVFMLSFSVLAMEESPRKSNSLRQKNIKEVSSAVTTLLTRSQSDSPREVPSEHVVKKIEPNVHEKVNISSVYDYGDIDPVLLAKLSAQQASGLIHDLAERQSSPPTHTKMKVFKSQINRSSISEMKQTKVDVKKFQQEVSKKMETLKPLTPDEISKHIQELSLYDDDESEASITTTTSKTTSTTISTTIQKKSKKKHKKRRP